MGIGRTNATLKSTHLGAGSSGDGQINIFTQLDEPEIKDGIWVKTPNKHKSIIIDNRVLSNDGLWDEVKLSTPYNMRGACAVLYNNEIHVLGGATYDSTCKPNYYPQYHYKWDGTSWIFVSELPLYQENKNFMVSAALVYNDEINIIISTGTTTKSKHYKFDGTSWIFVSELPYGFKSYNNNCAVVYNNEIHVFGGYNSSGKPANYHYKWDGTSWVKLSDLPMTNLTNGAVVYNDEIYVFGFNLTYGYKWNGTSWTKFYTPCTIYYGSVIVYDGCIHLLGSRSYGDNSDGQTTDNYYRIHYKFDGTSWTKLNKLPFDFIQGCAFVYDDEIYILAGGDTTNGTPIFGDVRISTFFKSKGDSWIPVINNLPVEFEQGCSVIYNGCIHILGCVRTLPCNPNKTYDTSTYEYQNYHYKFDGTSWIEASILPYEQFMMGSAVVYEDCIHIFGSGSDHGSTIHNYHYKWDGTSWTQVSVLPYTVAHTSALVYNNELYILGGYAHPSSDTTRPGDLYKWDGTSWTKVSSLPSAISSSSYAYFGIVFDGCIHILGGGSNGHHYKWDGTSWTQVSTLPYSLGTINLSSYLYGRYGSVTVYNNEIHILGGQDSAYYKSHYKWDGTSWTQLNDLPYKFQNGSSLVLNNHIILIGGSYSMMQISSFTTPENVYNENTLIIQRSNPDNGVYLTSLLDTSYVSEENEVIIGKQPRVVSAVDDVWYFGQNSFETDVPMYYGDGKEWIKFKN